MTRTPVHRLPFNRTLIDSTRINDELIARALRARRERLLAMTSFEVRAEAA